MFKSIVVVVDNSAQMVEVADYVSTLFPAAHFYLLSVINLGAFSGYYSKIAYKEMRELSEKSIGDMEELLETRSARFSSQVIVGDPVYEILSFAKSKQADLIILETHAGISTNKIKVGKTTASLIIHSHIPILLLGEDLHPANKPKILHPTTGSKYSEIATSLAAKFAKSHKSELEVLLLRDDPKIKERTEQVLKQGGVKASYCLSEGSEISSIISKSSSADIIIGSRGSPRPTYKFRFLVRSFALDPTVKLLVAFLPKPFLLVCD